MFEIHHVRDDQTRILKVSNINRAMEVYDIASRFDPAPSIVYKGKMITYQKFIDVIQNQRRKEVKNGGLS